MEKNEIYSIVGTDYKDMTIRILEAAGLSEDIGDKNKKIGVKPNILDAIKAEKGATTHPELVDGLLEYLTANGFCNISVMEGAWVGGNTTHAAEYTGILDICKKYGIPFVDLQKDSAVSCDAEGIRLSVCEKALEIDYMINLPVIKGHCQTSVTCALKNSKGLIPNSEKRRFHTMGLHKPIAHLNTVIRQDFILCDNICGDMDFEEGGNPIYMNRILCFKDPVLCDSFAAECMGHKPKDIEYIRLAEKLGVGSTDTAHAKITYLNEGIRERETMPHNDIMSKLAPYAAPVDACSACYGSLMHALLRLHEKGQLRGHEAQSIAIGQGYKGKTGELGVGSCTSCFQKNVKGCPPKAVDILEFLQKEWV